MVIRTSEATWHGGVSKGDGEMALGSGAWKGRYTFRSRFTEDEEKGSNPEELLGAAHAGCFSLALANNLEQAGFTPEEIQTTANCHLDMNRDAGPTITQIELKTKGIVPDIGPSKFEDFAEEAKQTCPVSRALSGVDISLEVTHES